MKVDGTDKLKARLRAIRLTFKLAGKEWAQEAVRQYRPQVPVRSGRLRQSFRVRNATQRRAVVGGHFTAYFVDAGTKPHRILPKTARRLRWSDGSRTIFARRVDHPRVRARPFRTRVAQSALRDKPVSAALIALWNRGA